MTVFEIEVNYPHGSVFFKTEDLERGLMKFIELVEAKESGTDSQVSLNTGITSSKPHVNLDSESGF